MCIRLHFQVLDAVHTVGGAFFMVVSNIRCTAKFPVRIDIQESESKGNLVGLDIDAYEPSYRPSPAALVDQYYPQLAAAITLSLSLSPCLHVWKGGRGRRVISGEP